jgi:hypothetical protein
MWFGWDKMQATEGFLRSKKEAQAGLTILTPLNKMSYFRGSILGFNPGECRAKQNTIIFE